MEFPLCIFDLKSGILCPRCEEKVRKGLYDELDIRIMRLLLELEKELPKLSKTGFVKAVDGGDIVFIIMKEDSLKNIDQDTLHMIRKKLREKLEKNVKIVEDDRSIPRFIEKLVAPARVVTINKIWLPDGSEEMRVILDRERSLKTSVPSIIEVVKKVKGAILRIDFEKSRWMERRMELSEKKAST
ncbi:MAG: hypothetical protein NZ929_01115 [Aigarchaeota archaeon]|nr:hypothetical protein [Aigarchaeota archaeon]MCX8192256.1 hypothetical protein [Nitrososphaeria archaeon]MDW7986136.1 hypothetical protein [Nitrososphaerota archaeon]